MLLRLNNQKQWQDFIRTLSIKPELKKEHKKILKELKELIVDSIKKISQKRDLASYFLAV